VRLRRTIAVAAVAVVVAIAIGFAVTSVGHHRGVADSCQVVGESTGAIYRMVPDQLANASTIADLAMRRGLPQQAVVVALATSMQESKLTNLDYGDRDSIGLFQQRPSQGWGSKEQLIDPIYATGKFYDALLKVVSWQSLPVAAAAQAVQRSGFPDAYASWQPRATALAAALTGTTDLRLTCRLAHPGVARAPHATATRDTKSVPDGGSGTDGGASTGSTAASASAGAASAQAGSVATTVSALTAALAADIDVRSPAVVSHGTKSATITISGLTAGTAASAFNSAAKHHTGTVTAWALAHAPAGITSVIVGDQEWRPDRDGWQHTADVAAAGTVVMTIALG
jgi:hypothetical protein